MKRSPRKKRQRINQYNPRNPYDDRKQSRLPFKDFIDSDRSPSSFPFDDFDDLPHPPRRRFSANSVFSVMREHPYIADARRAIFNDRRVLVCSARRVRREVLFAFLKAGRGISGPVRKFFNSDSNISCRR